jgi:hypothetical protein
LRRAKEKCYRFIPVEYNMAGVGTLKMFLDPETRILSSTAREANCQTRLFVERPEGLIQYDQKTGGGRRVDPSDVHEVPPGVRILEDDLRVEHFHDHILSNETLMVEAIYGAQHVEELRRENEFLKEDEIHAASKSEAYGATKHSLPGIIESLFFGWLRLAHTVWHELVAIEVTIVTLIVFASFCLPAGVWRIFVNAWRVVTGVAARARRRRRNEKGRDEAGVAFDARNEVVELDRAPRSAKPKRPKPAAPKGETETDAEYDERLRAFHQAYEVYKRSRPSKDHAIPPVPAPSGVGLGPRGESETAEEYSARKRENTIKRTELWGEMMKRGPLPRWEDNSSDTDEAENQPTCSARGAASRRSSKIIGDKWRSLFH